MHAPLLCLRSVKASSSLQNPTPMPAASAAPRLVVSRCAGRRTGTCRRSACICGTQRGRGRASDVRLGLGRAGLEGRKGGGA